MTTASRHRDTVGFVLAGDDTGAILECTGKHFLIEKGKVAKFVDR